MAFSDSWKIEKTLTRHRLQFFFLFGAHRLQLALNRGSRWSLMTEACKPLITEQHAIDEAALPIQNICAIRCKRAQGAGSCQSESIHLMVHRAGGGLSSPLYRCQCGSAEHCARCILVSTGNASPALHRSFLGKSPPASEFFFPYKK